MYQSYTRSIMRVKKEIRRVNCWIRLYNVVGFIAIISIGFINCVLDDWMDYYNIVILEYVLLSIVFIFALLRIRCII